ncbi:hypothetical protein [uncultured Methanobrevibacter sp.]|uniref:hypothetical protein n=1 Tax=uncultured Methanobrevibacter sp. TaxID=253161 RepID=UPI0025DC08A3|nr:hypothetical protein [uncultured Methanobrevibacter sp.]
MRRKKQDKRVLIPRNNSSQRSMGQRRSPRFMPREQNRRHDAPNKTNGLFMLVVIIALIAFVIGAGFGVSLSFDDGNSTKENVSHVQNVTKEMTTDLNQTNTVSFDKKYDGVDYNNKSSVATTKHNKSVN